ncbi:MAG TPA: selenoneine biosynthesis selenosugar synthase SenB [Burkholderiales bacterium]|jgi:putative glycosyltransferase (TIGR04348 family)
MKISLVTPAGPGLRNGNRHTALRWAAFLRAAGHGVKVSVKDLSSDADLMLALHARRSHESIVDFWRSHPDRRIVVALTGTDLYRDIRVSGEAQESLERADRLIVLQPKAAEELPERLRGKVRVVVQSSSTALRHKPPKGKFRICVIGHLREEKDPLRTLAALRSLPDAAHLEVVQIGALLDPNLKPVTKDKRYRWLKGMPHGTALRWLASSHAMVISSRMEGGANVVCEAIRIGVPILASYVSGNIGLLGDDYPGYFRVDDEKQLAVLISKASTNKGFYRSLRQHIAKLRPMVAPQSEKRALLEAIRV